MIRLEMEVMAGVSGFSIDIDIKCRSFPDDQHVQERNPILSFYFHDKFEGRSYTVRVFTEIL